MKKLINIRYAFKSILNKPIFSVILIIQLTASMYFLYNAIFFSDKSLQDLNRVSKLFNSTELNNLELTDELDNLFNIKFKEEDIIDRLKDFDEFITTSNQFTCIKYNNKTMLVEDFDKINNFYIKDDTASKEIQNNTFNRLHALSGNETFFNHFNFEVSEGRNFTEEDFNYIDTIPVILGNNFLGKFQINDTLKYYNELEGKIKTLRIIGFLNKDSYFFESTFAPEGLYNLNDYVISPTYDIYNCYVDKTDPNYESVVRNIYFNNILDTLLVSDKTPLELQKILQDKSDSLNLYNLKVNSAKDLLDSYKDMYNTQKKFMLILFFIILFFTSINMITTLTNHIRNRQKEFCVHLMYGATTFDIMKRILFEVFILLGISFIFMIFVNFALNKYSIDSFWNTASFVKVLIINIIMVIVLAIIPLKKLININLNDILKED